LIIGSVSLSNELLQIAMASMFYNFGRIRVRIAYLQGHSLFIVLYCHILDTEHDSVRSLNSKYISSQLF